MNIHDIDFVQIYVHALAPPGSSLMPYVATCLADLTNDLRGLSADVAMPELTVALLLVEKADDAIQTGLKNRSIPPVARERILAVVQAMTVLQDELYECSVALGKSLGIDEQQVQALARRVLAEG